MPKTPKAPTPNNPNEGGGKKQSKQPLKKPVKTPEPTAEPSKTGPKGNKKK